MKDMLLSLADELEGMDVREGCRTCPADGTKDCRGDLSCEEAVARAVARRVREIVEHDECEVTTVSAYDLLPEDEREAIAWVREQGGLETVKASVHQGAVEHGFLLKIAEMLGTSIYDGSDNADALLEKLSERLMPEGMEWPRFEEGEMLQWNDEYANGNGNASPLRHVRFYADGSTILGKGRTKVVLAPGERVKRPAPKVVDADGAEIHAGDTVYSIETGELVTVESIESGNPWFATTTGTLQHCSKFTHRAPVLAADGKPLRIGERAWNVHGGGPYEITGINHKTGHVGVKCNAHDGELVWGFPASELRHEQPDTWERLKEDAENTAKLFDKFDSDAANDIRDLVRRAKKLAEKEPR